MAATAADRIKANAERLRKAPTQQAPKKTPPRPLSLLPIRPLMQLQSPLVRRHQRPRLKRRWSKKNTRRKKKRKAPPPGRGCGTGAGPPRRKRAKGEAPSPGRAKGRRVGVPEATECLPPTDQRHGPDPLAKERQMQALLRAVEGDADAGPDDADEEVAPETTEEVVDDTEVVEEVELPPGVECVTATDCAGKLDPTDCDASSTLCCDAACTSDGECIYEKVELCCITVSDCEEYFPNLGGCDQIFCNTQSQACELQSPDNCCVTDEDCLIDGATCCTNTFCGNDKTCHVDEFSNCCVDDGDCDDGNEATVDVCEASCQNNGCANLAPECDVDKIFINKDLDDGGLQQMTVFDSHPDDDVGISVVQSTKVSLPYSVYLDEARSRVLALAKAGL